MNGATRINPPCIMKNISKFDSKHTKELGLPFLEPNLLFFDNLFDSVQACDEKDTCHPFIPSFGFGQIHI